MWQKEMMSKGIIILQKALSCWWCLSQVSTVPPDSTCRTHTHNCRTRICTAIFFFLLSFGEKNVYSFYYWIPPISKCRRDYDPGRYTFWLLAKKESDCVEVNCSMCALVYMQCTPPFSLSLSLSFSLPLALLSLLLRRRELVPHDEQKICFLFTILFRLFTFCRFASSFWYPPFPWPIPGPSTSRLWRLALFAAAFHCFAVPLNCSIICETPANPRGSCSWIAAVRSIMMFQLAMIVAVSKSVRVYLRLSSFSSTFVSWKVDFAISNNSLNSLLRLRSAESGAFWLILTLLRPRSVLCMRAFWTSEASPLCIASQAICNPLPPFFAHIFCARVVVLACTASCAVFVIPPSSMLGLVCFSCAGKAMPAWTASCAVFVISPSSMICISTASCHVLNCVFTYDCEQLLSWWVLAIQIHLQCPPSLSVHILIRWTSISCSFSFCPKSLQKCIF